MKDDGKFNSYPSKPESTTIDSLPEVLGFTETPELSEIRDQLIKAMTLDSIEDVRFYVSRYQELGRLIVEQLQGNDYVRAQIALSVAIALMRRDSERTADYIKDLDEALIYAENSNNMDIASLLDKAKVQEIVKILKILGPEYGFDEETCVDILETPFEGAIETAYSYLTQAGLDADEVLKYFFEDEQG